MDAQTLIDHNVLEQYCGHDVSTLQAVITAFKDTFKQDIQRLEQSLLAQNNDAIRFELHRMKGSLQILGANTTLQHLEDFNHRLNRGGAVSLEDAQTLLASLRRVLEQVQQLP